MAVCAALLILLFKRTERTGFYASAILLTGFTGYIAAVLLNAFPYIPCSCAGVIKGMSWRLHFFSTCFLSRSLPLGSS